MAGQPGEHRIDPAVQRHRLARLRQLVGQVPQQRRRVRRAPRAQQRRQRPHQHRPSPERLQLQAQSRQRRGMRHQARRVGLAHIDHRRQQQRLRPHAARPVLRGQRLMRQPLMRGMLVHQHQAAIPRHRDDIGVQHLRDRRTQRIGVGVRRRGAGRRGRHGTGRRGRLGEAKLRLGKPGPPAPRRRRQQMQRRPHRHQRRRPPRPHRQSAAEAADHQRPHRGRIAEPQLGLGRMHVHVQLVRRNGQVQRQHGMPPGGDHVAIGDPDGGAQHRVHHRAAIDHQRLRRRRGPAFHRRAGQALQPQAIPRALHRQQRRRGPRPQQRGDPRRTRLRRQVEHHPAVAGAAERDAGRGERQPAHRGLGMLGLDPHAFEEFAPRRRGEEQVGHHRLGARRPGGRPRRAGHAALHRNAPGMRRAWHAGGQAQPRRRPDAGQRLAAEAQRVDPHQMVVRQLGRAVPLHRQRQAVRRHAVAVIGDLDPRGAALVERDRDPPGPGVDRVLDQLLDHRGRPLDHLARRDPVDQRLRQLPDDRRGLGRRGRIHAGLHRAGYEVSSLQPGTRASGPRRP